MNVQPGRPFPLGATPTAEGTNFAVSSEIADAIEVCLFDQDGNEQRIELPARTAHVFHGLVSGTGPGQHYGLRVEDRGRQRTGSGATRPNYCWTPTHSRGRPGELGRSGVRAPLRKTGRGQPLGLGAVHA